MVGNKTITYYEEYFNISFPLKKQGIVMFLSYAFYWFDLNIIWSEKLSNLCLYLFIFQDSFVFYAQLELKLSRLLLIHLSLKLLILYTDFLHIVSWSFFVQYLEVWLYEVQAVYTIVLDMIAIPDFSAGAMENWGLITYRETAMLFKPGVSSEGNRQRVTTVITHELAHQVSRLPHGNSCHSHWQ